jgi:hypothetical protein
VWDVGSEQRPVAGCWTGRQLPPAAIIAQLPLPVERPWAAARRPQPRTLRRTGLHGCPRVLGTGMQGALSHLVGACWLLLLAARLATAAEGAQSRHAPTAREPKSIYGGDDRLDEDQVTDPAVLAVGRATAVLVSGDDLRYSNGQYYNRYPSCTLPARRSCPSPPSTSRVHPWHPPRRLTRVLLSNVQGRSSASAPRGTAQGVCAPARTLQTSLRWGRAPAR